MFRGSGRARISGSLHCYAFCQIPRFVGIIAALYGAVIGEKLCRDDRDNRGQCVGYAGDQEYFVGTRGKAAGAVLCDDERCCPA